MKLYDIIYTDPPWQYASAMVLAKKSILDGKINTHYPTMAHDQLKELVIPAKDNALMFMWVVSPMLNQGIDLMEHWGFKYATIAFVWEKVRVNPGFYTMSSVEICIVGKRGKIPQPRGKRNVRQFLSETKTRHSAKPSIIRDRITEMFPTQDKLEMFARVKSPGWDVWGNEV